MREGLLCRREGITINIFLLPSWSQSREDVQFAYRLAESTEPELLGLERLREQLGDPERCSTEEPILAASPRNLNVGVACHFPIADGAAATTRAGRKKIAALAAKSGRVKRAATPKRRPSKRSATRRG